MPAQMNRAQFLTRAAFLSSSSFVTVGLGAVLLVTLGQVRETVEAFASPIQVFWFLVAEFYWALCAWYCARLVIERSFAPLDQLLPCTSPRFAAWVVRWLPRGVGLFAMVPLAVSVALSPVAGIAPWVRPLPAMVAVIFFVFVVYRRRLFRELVHYLPSEPEYAYRRFDRINRRGWTLLIVLAVVPIEIFLMLAIGPRGGSRWLGTPAVVLFALGSWNLSAGFALIYWPLSRGWTVLTVYPILWAVAISAWMENHNTPIGPPLPAAAAVVEDRRPDVRAQWSAWVQALDATACADWPIYVVAAAGGASRAAYWTASILTALEDNARTDAAAKGEPPCFARNIFAISGVSGGSLGAATVVSLLADEQARGRPFANLSTPARAFLTEDMLAPVAGYLLYQDLVQRFVPFPFTAWDRSRGLELTWIADWHDLETAWEAGSGAAPPNWFGAPLESLYADSRGATLPSVFLNTTRVSDGRRALQSNVRFAPGDMYDVFSPGFVTATLTLAGAVDNSARFTYVSPAGRVFKVADGAPEPWGYLVDGGYFENSGAATLAEMLSDIPAFQRRRITLLLISNDPSDGRKDYVCAGGPAPEEDRPSSLAIEAVAPPFALLNTRAARAHAADIAAVRLLGPDGPRRVFELRLPAVEDGAGHNPPMTWFVSDAVADQMDAYIGLRPGLPPPPPTKDAGRFRTNMQALVQAVLAGAGPAASPCGSVMGGAPTTYRRDRRSRR